MLVSIPSQHVPGVSELVFKLYDIDRNGKLEKDELRRAIVAQGTNVGDAEVGCHQCWRNILSLPSPELGSFIY